MQRRGQRVCSRARGGERQLICNTRAQQGKKSKGGQGGGQKKKHKKQQGEQAQPKKKQSKKATQENEIPEIIELAEESLTTDALAEKLNLSVSAVIKTLFQQGIMVTLNQSVGKQQAKAACSALGVECLDDQVDTIRSASKRPAFISSESDASQLCSRDPVVTVMGHVDHGKTTLLDYLRKTRVTSSEDGGITQSIGAYTVNSSDGNAVFLDTPGHEAFSAMRARGTRVTDVAVLVVAADDGVRPQTVEAIGHARAAGVPLVVAVNKIDLQSANPMRTLSDLSEQGVLVEDFGGDTPAVQISALTGYGVDELLETIVLSAQMQELQAISETAAEGTVIESTMDTFKGPTATLLVQNGTLNKGDVVRAGVNHGRVRALTDDTGASVAFAGPSKAVEMIGLDGVPEAGELFSVYQSLSDAREACEEAEEKRGTSASATTASQASLAGQAGKEREVLNIIVKAGASGSVEAVKSSLQGLPQDKVALRFLLASTGEVSSSDVTLASASGAVILAFDAPVSSRVLTEARERAVEVRQYNVIYSLLEDVQKAMLGMLPPIQEEEYIGDAQVLAVFGSGKWRVAGCRVNSGRIDKNCLLRVNRDGEEVFAGTCTSLRRVKDDVTTVDEGFECGIGAREFTGWREGDKIAAFQVINRDPTLE